MANANAKGNVSITINSDETEAKLVFTPDEKGSEWDVAAVNKLIGENHLAPPLLPKVLDPFLLKASRSKQPLDMVIFNGVPAEDAVNEAVNWEEGLATPADIAALKDETLSNAGKPELYRTKIERIKKETVVKKASPLPFLPGKEEVVVNWEKKETKEAVEVDAAVKDVKYVEKGKKLGVIFPSKPGKPGKSVFGKPIQPASKGDSTFFLGSGLVRNRSDINALESGFLRIGEGWADIVPLSKHSWEINKGADGITLFLKFSPGDPRFPVPAGEEIIAEAIAKGAAADNLVSVEGIDAEIKKAVETGEEIPVLSLFRIRQAEVRVDISPDGLQASLYLRKGIAGALPLEIKAVSQAIKDSKVHGFDADALRNTIHAFMSGKELELKDYLLVQGKPSSRGKAREVKIAAPLLSAQDAEAVLKRIKAHQAEYLGGGEFPLEELTGMGIVAKGAKLALIEAPVPGESGKDVFGNILPGIPGNDPELKLLRGVELHGQNITSSQSGLFLAKLGKGSFTGTVIDYEDAKAVIHISADAMEVTAELVRESGAGRPLTEADVKKALADAGVVKGIIEGAVENACNTARAKGRCVQVLARGELPVAKGNSRVKWLLPVRVSPAKKEEKSSTAEIAEGLALAKAKAAAGHAAEKKAVPAVKPEPAAKPPPEEARPLPVTAGAPIAEIYEPEAADRPGFDVKGKVLQVKDASPITVEHGDSVREETVEKGSERQGSYKKLFAVHAGELTYDGRKLEISSTHGVKGDVGPSTGNIKFSGEIRITGKIQPGFAVMAGRNVLVAGAAESAMISSGGKVVVVQGINGEGKGIVRAKNTIEAGFAEKATLMAVEDICLKAGSILCNIKTNGKLLITAETGKLAGGVCKARFGVDVTDIGHLKGNRTEISFGQDYLVQDQIDVMEKEIEKVKAALVQIEVKIKEAAGNTAVLDKVRLEKVKLMKSLEQFNLKVFTLREKFEEHFDSEIRIRGTIYPGVVMESHNRYYEIIQARSHVIFYFDRETGRIKAKEWL
ncbi:MAG: FapA family protein [Treponema sp.]|jgi:uncharacterized protein (DUF342 family)|nr:FapA family protein [Treponema sp.]